MIKIEKIKIERFIVVLGSIGLCSVSNRYATLIFTNPVFLGFSRYQNVNFGSQRDNFKKTQEQNLGKYQHSEVFLFMISFGF